MEYIVLAGIWRQVLIAEKQLFWSVWQQLTSVLILQGIHNCKHRFAYSRQSSANFSNPQTVAIKEGSFMRP